MRKNKKRLVLHRETVHSLSQGLENVGGGGETYELITGCSPFCISDCCGGGGGGGGSAGCDPNRTRAILSCLFPC